MQQGSCLLTLCTKAAWLYSWFGSYKPTSVTQKAMFILPWMPAVVYFVAVKPSFFSSLQKSLTARIMSSQSTMDLRLCKESSTQWVEVSVLPLVVFKHHPCTTWRKTQRTEHVNFSYLLNLNLQMCCQTVTVCQTKQTQNTLSYVVHGCWPVLSNSRKNLPWLWLSWACSFDLQLSKHDQCVGWVSK